jgi:hypothetical protein
LHLCYARLIVNNEVYDLILGKLSYLVVNRAFLYVLERP